MKPMTIVLLGGKGMLGSDLVDAARARGWQPVALDLPEIDITREAGLAEAIPPCDAVINCAAFTRVDDAEKERELCWSINANGAGHVARACASRELPLIHLSTDYVFDGRKGSDYGEDDPVAPLNYYGESKLAGEQQVLVAGGGAVVVRTQSLFGLRGRSFIRAILNQIQQGKTSLRVVADQVSSPTYTPHLADALLRLLAVKPPAGVINVAARGHCSWWEFAAAIVARVKPGLEILKLSTAELSFPALRPAYSVLNTTRYTSLTGHPMPRWEEGLEAYLAADTAAQALKKL
jgi:dTDP-4-dehydrorhamnose reductase